MSAKVFLKFSSKNFNHFLNSLRQLVDFFARVVKSERRPRRRGNVEELHHGLGTVMSGADGDALLVEDRADVVRVDVFDGERQHAALFRCRADDSYACDRR